MVATSGISPRARALLFHGREGIYHSKPYSTAKTTRNGPARAPTDTPSRSRVRPRPARRPGHWRLDRPGTRDRPSARPRSRDDRPGDGPETGPAGITPRRVAGGL